MSGNDMFVNSTSTLPINIPTKVNPHFLIKLHPEPGAKVKNCIQFLAIEKHSETTNFINVKGFFIDVPGADIEQSWQQLVASTEKTKIVEMYFPVNMVYNIKSLVYKAK